MWSQDPKSSCYAFPLRDTNWYPPLSQKKRQLLEALLEQNSVAFSSSSWVYRFLMQIKKTNANTTVKVLPPQQILMASAYFTISVNDLQQFQGVSYSHKMVKLPWN